MRRPQRGMGVALLGLTLGCALGCGDKGDAAGDSEAAVVYDCDGEGEEEVCDERDNDCDGVMDEGCALVTDASWDLDTPAQLSCSGLESDVDIDSVNTARMDLGFAFTFDAPAGSTTLMGGFGGGDFDGQLTVRAACERAWSVDGALLSPFDMEATLSLTFTGGECGDCADTSWALRGRR